MANDKKKRIDMDDPPFFEHLRGAYEEFKRSAHVPEEAMLAYVKGQLSQATGYSIKAHMNGCPECQELESTARAFAEHEGHRSEVSEDTIAQIITRAKKTPAVDVVEESPSVEIMYEGVALKLRKIAAWGSKILYEVIVPGPGDFSISRSGTSVRFAVNEQNFMANPAFASAKGHQKRKPCKETDATTFDFSNIGVEVRFVLSGKGPRGTQGEAHFDIEVTEPDE